MTTIRLVLALVSVALLGCAVTQPSDSLSVVRVVAVGHPFTLTVGTIGPGNDFLSPPSISSAAIVFDSVSLGPIITPGGEGQVFYFTAREIGVAVVHFQRVPGDPNGIADLVEVR